MKLVSGNLFFQNTDTPSLEHILGNSMEDPVLCSTLLWNILLIFCKRRKGTSNILIVGGMISLFPLGEDSDSDVLKYFGDLVVNFEKRPSNGIFD